MTAHVDSAVRPASPTVSAVRKRDGRVVEFELDRIARAISRAGAATGEFDGAEALLLARFVTRKLVARHRLRTSRTSLNRP